MRGSLKIGRIAGIDLGIHWTFLLLLLFVIFTANGPGGGIDLHLAGLRSLLILSIFFCVLLHELGHSFAALRFGISTRDITLSPIGGLARLERMPEAPKQELLVALAGPAVNLVIAAAIFAALMLSSHPLIEGGDSFTLDHAAGLFTERFSPVSLWEQLFVVNLYLLLFNLLPALPMDGGRVLRSLLAFRINRLRATQISSRVGQAFAIGFIVYGVITWNIFLPMIGMFVLSGAENEFQYAKVKYFLTNFRVGDAMISSFKQFSVWDTASEVFEEMKRTGGREFLVIGDEKTAGVIHQKQILKAMATGQQEELLCKIMTKDFKYLNEEDTLDKALIMMEDQRAMVVPVVKDNQVTGLLSFERTMEFIQMHRFMESEKPGRKQEQAKN